MLTERSNIRASKMQQFSGVSGGNFGISLSAVVFTLLCALATTKVDAFEFVDQPVSRDLVEGRNAILQCSVDDNTNIAFRWTLDGEDIANDDRRTVTDGYLYINGVDRVLDLGEFRCVATDTVSSESKTSSPAELNIIWIQPSAKVALKSPGSIDEVKEGSRVILNCKLDGNPTPDIEWYRDRQRLESDDNFDPSRSKLRIQSARVQDSGVYSCQGRNRAGESWSTGGNLTLTILDANFPVNQVAPEDVLAVIGGKAEFHCEFSGNPDPTIEWYFRGSVNDGSNVVHLANGTSTKILPNGTLVISNIVAADEGAYICIGRSELGEPDVEARLTIAKVEELPNLGARIVPDGDRLSVNCTYPYGVTGGIPIPQISWLDQSGNPVSSNPQDRVHTEWGSLLVFKRLEKADNGNFTCKASNIAGEKTAQLPIIVATVPEFTLRPKDTSGKEYSDCQLHCQADGNPSPRIKWLHGDGRELQDDRFTVLDNGTLHITNLLQSDKGVYACQVATVAGSDVAEATLSVIPVLKFTSVPKTVQLELGDDSKIICQATGRTPPTIRWFKLPYRTKWDSHINETDGKLGFYPAQKSDKGQYVCVATAGDEVINATVQIDVLVRPKFIIAPSNVTGYEGYSVTIDCQATGDPMPIINWMAASSAKLESPRMKKLENGSLYIKEVKPEDAGNYQCIAGSDAGLSNTEITLIVKKGSPPGSTPFTPQLMHRTIAIAVGCALAYIILVVGLMWWCRQRRLKQRRLMKEEAAAAEAGAQDPAADGETAKLNGSLPHQKTAASYHDEDPKADGMSNGDMAMNPLMKGAGAGRRGSYDRLQFPRHDLQTLVVIGHGSYGEVFLAKAAGITEGVEATNVMVKALQNKNETQQMDFRREMDMLSKLSHDNIIKLLGMCREAEPQLMITEYLEWGDLKQYLHATRGENGTTNVPPPLTLSQKLDVVSQVAMGMEHLSSHRYIHGDLAARNCLLSPTMETKISMMSVSRDLYRTEYHEYKQKLVPIRWMPAEAIFEDELSTKSDVWAYGIFVWEIFSQGELPYKNLDNDGLMRALLDGNVALETPTGTPDEVEILMHRCWAESAKERYSFSDIVLALQSITPDSSV